MYFLEVLKTDLDDYDTILISSIFHNHNSEEVENDIILKEYIGNPFKMTDRININTPVRRFVGKNNGDSYSIKILNFYNELLTADFDIIHDNYTKDEMIKFCIDNFHEKDKFIQKVKEGNLLF